jgi:hypothetical protein
MVRGTVVSDTIRGMGGESGEGSSSGEAGGESSGEARSSDMVKEGG